MQFKNGLAIARLFPVYALIGVLKHIFPLTSLVRWAWRPATGPRDPAIEGRISSRVLRLSQLLGLPDRDCLQRSVLLYRVLSRAGAEPMLVVGLKRLNGRIVGHAWVTVDGRPIFESEADLLQFTPTLRLGRRGAVVSVPTDSREADDVRVV
jgi:Transglutaminase-like superfamily